MRIVNRTPMRQPRRLRSWKVVSKPYTPPRPARSPSTGGVIGCMRSLSTALECSSVESLPPRLDPLFGAPRFAETDGSNMATAQSGRFPPIALRSLRRSQTDESIKPTSMDPEHCAPFANARPIRGESRRRRVLVDIGRRYALSMRIVDWTIDAATKRKPPTDHLHPDALHERSE